MKSVKELKVELAEARVLVKKLVGQIKLERSIERSNRQGLALQRKERAEAKRSALAAKRVERIAALEAKLEALRLKAVSPKALKKAARKASPVKLIPKDAA
jgi:hypothetical protein